MIRIQTLMRKIFEEITFFGGIAFYMFIIFLLLILGKIDYVIQISMGLIAIYLITLVIRIFYFKERPKKIHYEKFLEKIDASSFPSVHAARVVFLGLFVIFNLVELIYLILLVPLLISVLYSRIYLKKHDIRDIFGGVALGIFVFWILYMFF